jgi:hypothetical protein
MRFGRPKQREHIEPQLLAPKITESLVRAVPRERGRGSVEVFIEAPAGQWRSRQMKNKGEQPHFLHLQRLGSVKSSQIKILKPNDRLAPCESRLVTPKSHPHFVPTRSATALDSLIGLTYLQLESLIRT